MKTRFTAILLAAVMLLPSCGDGRNNSNDEVDMSNAYLQYPLEDARCFAVDGDGIIYAAEGMHSTVHKYDADGVETAVYEIDLLGSIGHMCVNGGTLYFTILGAKTETLYSYDTATQTLAVIAELTDFKQVTKIEYLKNRIYILGIDPNYINREYDVWEGGFSYSYDGTVLASYDVESGVIEIVHDELTSNFSLSPRDTLIIQAYDSIGGYYFTELDLADNSTGDKIYRNVDGLKCFAADDNGVVFYSLNGSKTAFLFTLSYTSLKEDLGIADVMPNVWVLSEDGIAFRDGFTYYCNTLSKKVERIKNAVYIKDNPKIKMIASNNYLTDSFSAGYSVGCEELSAEEFALTVLSRDKKYDICYMSSRQDFSSNIKDKGSFYPLNDVPGVKEYFDACFPFIKDAATNEDGDIWMLPIDVSVSAMIYHAQNSKDAGIYFSSIATVEDVIAAVDKAQTIDPENTLYSLNGFSLIQRSLVDYLRDNDTLETPEFRRLAQALKKFKDKGIIRGNPAALDNYAVFGTNPGFLFCSDDMRIYQTKADFIGRKDLKAIPITGTDGPGSAICIFLCVNPDSDNLKSTLEYISSVCSYMMSLKNAYMLTDKSLYTDSDYARSLYALYENSVIDFNVSDEVFMDDFNRYLNDELTLDDMIKEADRKLAMYRGE